MTTDNTQPWDGKYPVRCEITDVTGKEVLPGVQGRIPDESKTHIGKKGLAEETNHSWRVKITLDDGNILYGEDCWWTPLPNES